MEAPSRIVQLIEHFDRNYDHYKSNQYNETQLRREFLDPFFIALGWDVNNESGTFDAYKDVIHEDAIKIGGFTKAPDYCFRVGGARKFFVEAKKPAVNIKDDATPAYQLRRYAWSAKLHLSILSDFEELAIYDCRIKPNLADKASVARTLFFNYKDYLTQWDKIASIFSKEAVWKGELDKYADVNKLKKGTTEVDDAFLDEIENWRDILARNLALRNESLTQRQLNEIVQKTIDRIVFLRICEDRNIEKYGRLINLLNGANIYPRLCQLFQEADAKYNSGLFHFETEKEQNSPPDELSLNLNIDDKVLKEIIKKLYYPDSPYEFSVLPADILGQVYEQFLGKVIRLTAGHQAKVEEKPEVKKAGGVYYTPTYIVDYIVNNTVGKLLENKTPKEASELKILDPACGSGSFLIVAYQKLLDWHLKWYLDNIVPKIKSGSSPSSKAIQELIPLAPEITSPKKRKSSEQHLPIIELGSNDWRLTMAERKRILLNNIFGVDIDSQAVEVTKLSLLLKVLENESEQTLTPQLKLFQDRALPDLGNNIKCGNSLIGSDYYAEKVLFLEEDEFGINAFDWEREFQETMLKGGFDAIIGNPPYIPIEAMTDAQKQYYQACFPQLERKYDSAAVFILSQLKNLKQNGFLSYISSLTWQTGENFSRLRESVIIDSGLVSIVNLPFNVFKNAYVDTGIYIFSKLRTSAYKIYRFPKKSIINNLVDVPFSEIPYNLLQPPDYKIILDATSAAICHRLKADSAFTSLGDLTISTQGLAANRYELFSGAKDSSYPFLESGQVFRYVLSIDEVCYTMMTDKPSLREYYEATPKVLIRRVINRQDRLMSAFTDSKMVFKKDVNPFILIDHDVDQTLFLLGILNSKLISFIYVNSSSIATKDDFRQTTLAELRQLSIPNLIRKYIDDRFIKMKNYVSKMNSLNKQFNVSKSEQEKIYIQRQIDATDRMIDQLVYELYGLTEEEIKIVEEG